VIIAANVFSGVMVGAVVSAILGEPGWLKE
jgi:hypothetical protein